MKTTMAVAMLVAMMTGPGCALFRADAPTADKLADVQRLAYAAASVGTQVALVENPDWRVQFQEAYHSLDSLVEGKIVTGAFLRETLAKLPIKELKSQTARIVIENATFLYDASVANKVNIEKQPYIEAAARGIRDGMKAGLGIQ